MHESLSVIREPASDYLSDAESYIRLNNPIVNNKIGFIVLRNEVEMLRLRELRERRGYSVKDMCRILGVDDSRYRKWESGTNGLPLDYSLACCDALHCTLDDLAGRTVSSEYDTNSLSDEERVLVDLYRKCSHKGRELLIQVATVTVGVFGRE